MNVKVIRGLTTSLVALSEFTPIHLASGEETQIQFFIEKGSVHTILGRSFLADKNIRLEFSHKQGKILSYQEPDGRRLCMPICEPQALGWQTSPPRRMDLCSMEKLVIITARKQYQVSKGENTILNLTQKTHELSISAKCYKFGQELQKNQWPNNLKRQLEDTTSEDQSPSIISKTINKTEETFQILVNGNPFKTKHKINKVRFGEHHELSDDDIIN
ncbi:hypothetical protein O181_014842 [Austropuccinia psidii MF-1]|uniref:Uncharacterized protein n=1 Tax=Austropuccinia psidii MF-1 TaxID=1389203 RepID=A0A9Q3C2F0_9BASI|nr:hypothetical protein [Austropuccinia psidii MF-1]